jgi:hypothetical protein
MGSFAGLVPRNALVFTDSIPLSRQFPNPKLAHEKERLGLCSDLSGATEYNRAGECGFYDILKSKEEQSEYGIQ